MRKPEYPILRPIMPDLIEYVKELEEHRKYQQRIIDFSKELDELNNNLSVDDYFSKL